MREVHVNTVLGYLTAAQTVLAIYGSPDGPTDPASCHRVLAELLEDPALLRAQLALTPADRIIIVMGEAGTTSLVIEPPIHVNAFPLASSEICG